MSAEGMGDTPKMKKGTVFLYDRAFRKPGRLNSGSG